MYTIVIAIIVTKLAYLMFSLSQTLWVLVHVVLNTDLFLLQYHTNQFGSLQYNSASKHGYDQGLHQFNQLLNSKQFILIFIRTLEQQKNFSIRDKWVHEKSLVMMSVTGIFVVM